MGKEESKSANKDSTDSAKDTGLSRYDALMEELKRQTQNRPKSQIIKPDSVASLNVGVPIDQTIKKERARTQEIANNNRVSDQKLKSRSLIALFIFLGIETLAIFALAFAQGFEFKGFKLDEWSMRIIIVATLGQITAMLTIAVQHLFPNNNRK